MAARNATPLIWKARGLSDAQDGTNTFPGAMQQLANLIPSPTTQELWVPRPGAQTIANFGTAGASPIWGSFKWGAANWGGFNSPAQINCLLVVGNIAYGMVAETAGAFAGKDVPFVLNLSTGAFFVVTIPGAASTLPTTPATTGDWTPPTMAQIAGRVMITHPGYPGGATKIGWLDVSGFSSATLTGNTHSTTTIDTLSSNPITAGWQPGMTVTGTGIPSNTTIVSLTASAIVISQAATSSSSGITLTVAGGTATSPLYGSGDTNTNNLPAVPTCVSQFNGRAYYGFMTTAGVGVALVLSDSGNPTQVTNATQALSFNNGLGVTALAGLPLSNQLGGVVGSLMAFQGDANIFQITGDPANSTPNLATNSLNIATGTLAPNSIAPTPLGLAFIAPDGLRIIQFNAVITEPIGRNGSGVAVPFINAINPSRMAAAYNQNVYRCSVMNGSAIGQPTQEYWYDFGQRVWSGPHSFPAAQIAALQGSANSFLMAATGINAKLWQSDVLPTANSVYTENGNPIACTWETVLLPDTDLMYENAVVESSIGLQLPPQLSLLIQANDEGGNLLGSVTLTGAATGATVWGSFNWNAAPWGGATGFFRQYPINWANVLVFKQMTVTGTANALSGFSIGNLALRYQRLGYLMQAAGGRV